MARIIYQSPTECQEYIIGEQTQKLMAYLYLYGPANPHKLIEHMNLEGEAEVMDAVGDAISKGAAGFISVRETGQQTIGGDRVQEVAITTQGEQFVERYQSEIAVPFSVQAFTRRMQRIQDEMAGRLHRFEELFVDADAEPEEERERELEEVMEQIEGHFDTIREKAVDDS